MKRYIVVMALIAILCTLNAGNSIFSYEGFPVRFYGNDIYGLSMGDTGSADLYRFNSGLGNPALHNASQRSILATGMIFGYTRYQSEDSGGNKNSFMDNSLDLPHFSLSFPIKNHRLGFQFNSYASGLVKNQRSFLTADSLQVKEIQKMDRYLYRGDLVYSVKLGSYSFGVAGNYYLGHESREFYQDGGFGFYNTQEELSRSFKNPSFTVGAIAQYPWASVGINYSMGAKLKGKSQRKSLDTTDPEENYELELPYEAGLGVTLLPLREHKLNVEVRWEGWSQTDANSKDAIKLGLGWAYEPQAETRDSYWKKMSWRGGVSWRTLPFQVAGADVNEIGFSLGSSFPLKRDINRLDVGIIALQRGSLAQNKLSDTSIMMVLGFTGFDIIGKASDRTAPREIPIKEELTEW